MTRADSTTNNTEYLSFDPIDTDEKQQDNLQNYRVDADSSVLSVAPLREEDSSIQPFGFPEITGLTDLERGAVSRNGAIDADASTSEESDYCLTDCESAPSEVSKEDLDKLMKTFEKGDARSKAELIKMGRGALEALGKLADTTDDWDSYSRARETIKAIRANDPVLSKLGSSPRPYSEKTAAALIEKLGSDSYVDRERASDYLQEMGKKVLPALNKVFEKTKDPEVRRRASRGIQIIEATDHFDRLFKDLNDDNSRVRGGARDGLIKMGQAVLPDLNKVADSTDDIRLFTECRKAIEAIRRNDPFLRDKPARAFNQLEADNLIKKLDSKNPIERLRAIEYITDMGAKVLPTLEKQAQSDAASAKVKEMAKKLSASIREAESDEIELVQNKNQ